MGTFVEMPETMVLQCFLFWDAVGRCLAFGMQTLSMPRCGLLRSRCLSCVLARERCIADIFSQPGRAMDSSFPNRGRCL